MKVTGDFHVRPINLTCGRRYWAFHLPTGDDREFGLDPDGYGSEAEAVSAARKAQRTLNLNREQPPRRSDP